MHVYMAGQTLILGKDVLCYCDTCYCYSCAAALQVWRYRVIICWLLLIVPRHKVTGMALPCSANGGQLAAQCSWHPYPSSYDKAQHKHCDRTPAEVIGDLPPGIGGESMIQHQGPGLGSGGGRAADDLLYLLEINSNRERRTT